MFQRKIHLRVIGYLPICLDFWWENNCTRLSRSLPSLADRCDNLLSGVQVPFVATPSMYPYLDSPEIPQCLSRSPAVYADARTILGRELAATSPRHEFQGRNSVRTDTTERGNRFPKGPTIGPTCFCETDTLSAKSCRPLLRNCQSNHAIACVAASPADSAFRLRALASVVFISGRNGDSGAPVVRPDRGLNLQSSTCF